MDGSTEIHVSSTGILPGSRDPCYRRHMQLPGRLSASTLGDLLGALHREHTTGQLELVEIRGPRGRSVPGRRHRIELRQGLITAVDTGLPVPPLGEILRREGLVGSTVLAWLVRRLGSGDDRASGEILIGDGFARPEVVRAGLKKQLQERVEALFTLEEAGVTFHTARPPRRVAARVDPLPASEFLHGRPRRRDRVPPSSEPGSGSGSPSSRGDRGGPSSAPPSSAPSSSAPSGSRAGEARSLDPRDHARRLLGISDQANIAEVRRAFRKIAVALHPDRFEAAPAEVQQRHIERFARISAAYHLLVA